MPFEVIGIDHVQITVPKALVGECLAFYREGLWLEEIPKPEGLYGRGGAWFRVGPIQLHIGVDTDSSPTSKRHVCLLVQDVAAAKSQVAEHGIAIEEESKTQGLERFFIHDPAGNRIEIGQRN